MSFQPVVPIGGNAGWAFLSRTREAQQAAFEASPALQRDMDYFRQTIGTVQTAEALVNDPRLLRVALGAFGLDSDFGNKFFIRKVLEDGTLEQGTLANRLADKRYFAMSQAFGFGDVSPPNTVLSNFADAVLRDYGDRQFEAAIGVQSPELRLALSLERELGTLAATDGSDEAKWFTVMATPPLRAVFEGAFGLPAATGALDVDRQLTLFRDKAQAAFGSSDLAQFADPDRQDDLRRLYLGRSAGALAPAASVQGSAALAILQASAPPGGLPSLLS